jgi:capsular polysaccharide transport system ATP-binding protein
MKGRLNFALSMAFDFDCLLIDEGLSAGDARFTEKCKVALNNKINSSIILVTHSMGSIKDFCDIGYTLNDGALVKHGSIDDTIKAYERK